MFGVSNDSDGAIAFVDPALGAVSYGQLREGTKDWAARLEALAKTLGGRPLLEVELSARAPVIAAYLGALQAGYPVILSAPGQSAKDARIREIYRPNAVLAMEADAAQLTRLSDDLTDLHPDLTLMMSTSGSTGDPKLVRHSGDAIGSNAEAITQYMALTEADVGITALPLHYSYGLSVLHSHLTAGARLILTEASVSDPAFAADFAAHGVTNLQCVPHQIDLLGAAGFSYAASPAFRLLTQAGGRLEKAKVRQLALQGQAEGWAMMVMYGQTEAAPRMAYLPGELAAENPETIGVAIPGGRFEVTGDDGHAITEPGQAGALRYFGLNVMMGYASTRADLAQGRGANALETGDIAEWTQAGLLRITGRAKRFAKLYGLRLSLDQVEVRLAEVGLAGRVVCAGERLVILTREADQLEAIGREVSAAYDLPASDVTVGWVQEIAVLPSGKTDYAALNRKAEALVEDQRAQADAQGQSLREVYAGALRARNLGGKDSFVSLGGDSLAYLHVQMALEARLGHLPDGWEEMPLERLEAMEPKVGRGWRSVDVQTVLRLMAISAVVLFHANHWPLMGGTSALILLFGYSLARFQQQTIRDGRLFRLAGALLVPILPFYLLLISAYDFVRGGVPASMFLLTDNYHKGVQVPLVEPYWFVSLYAQLVAVVLVVALVPALRGAVGRRPFSAGVIGFVLAILLSAIADATHLAATDKALSWRSMTNFLPLAALGWMLFCARNRRERAITLAALAAVLAIYPIPNLAYLALVGAGSLALMGNLRVPMPASGARAANHLASATFFVFLLHNIVIHIAKHVLPLHGALGPWMGGAVILGVSFVLALIADYVWRHICRWIITRPVFGQGAGPSAIPAE